MTYIKLLTVLTTLALLTACGGTAETKTDDTGDTAVPCDTNPYGEDCGTEFETQRLNIVSECRTDNTGDFCNDAITFFCDETTIRDLLCRETTAYKELIAMEQNECLTRTGSQPACDEEERVKTCEASAFSTNCADTKYVMQRETMCLADTTINPACTGTTGIATLFCEANPFDTATPCMHGDYADERQTMCLANIQIDDSCRGDRGIATLFCTANPFDPSNACMHGDYADERLTECTGDITTPRCMQIVTPVCEANNGFNNPVCRGIAKYDEQLRCATTPACADGVITTADWLEGFDAPLNTAGDRERTEAHEFLQGTEVGLDVGTVRYFTRPPNVVTLNLESFGGEAKNGVAWFIGLSGAEGLDLPFRPYSGIFSGTNLGAPLASADVSVSVPWKGTFGNILYKNVNSLSPFDVRAQNFELTVDFTNSEIRAFVKRDIFALADTGHFVLNAEFDDRGRFDGIITYGTFAGNDKDATPTNVTNGVLTGLIGELGAVGVFISNEADVATTNQAFAGGFVAISQKEAERVEQAKIKYTDWIGGFDTEPPTSPSVSPAINQFLAGTTTLDPLTTATPTLLTSTIGGVGFFTENSAYYAGLLANTNVGLPVEITPQANSADVTATWRGKIQAIGVFLGRNSDTDPDNTSTMDFDLTVNFTARTLTGQARDSRHSGSLGRRIDINGNFLEANNGVITTGTAIARVANVARSGVLTGIIGQEGAVGAFIGDGFSGGFYVTPPAN